MKTLLEVISGIFYGRASVVLGAFSEDGPVMLLFFIAHSKAITNHLFYVSYFYKLFAFCVFLTKTTLFRSNY